jgi:DNA-binding NtrC family response regulator
MNRRDRILVVGERHEESAVLERLLAGAGYQVDRARGVPEALSKAQLEDFDVVLTDLDLNTPGKSGLDVVSHLRALKPSLPVILIAEGDTSGTAIDATRLGAYDYLARPPSWADEAAFAELEELLKAAIRSNQRMNEPVDIGGISEAKDAIVGRCRAMQQVYKEIGRVAATPLTVLIRGETGTGKELVARAIFSHSDRARQPFVVVNCAAIPQSLLESELFGHERGAFTGASVRRLGRFEQAHRGTIFLDEIGDMNPALQQKMLRVLQEKTIERVGGAEPVPVDVRVLAATHRDLEQAIQEGAFRQDLYFRLNVAVIWLPPLRERTEDIPDLVRYFLQRYGPELGSDRPSLKADEQPQIWTELQQQLWPGNVRELRNVVRKALLLSRGFAIDQRIIREAMAQTRPPQLAAHQSFAAYVARVLASAKSGERESVLPLLMEKVESELYGQAIQRAGGAQSKAAAWLGVSRPTMREKLRKYGLHPARGN